MAQTSSSPANIKLFRGWLDPGKHVWSPFVIKVEARLRFAGVPYLTDAGSVRSAPTGKIPYVECRGPLFADDEHSVLTMGDSTLIIKELSQRGIIPDLNSDLSPEARTQDLALRGLLEDKLYFYHTWERWIQNYTMRDHILWSLPWPARWVVGSMIYRNVNKTLHGQGTGRYTPEQIAAFRLEIWEAINGLLSVSRTKSQASIGDDEAGPFWALGGNEPTEVDAVIFGFIVSVLICTAAPDSSKVVRSFPILLDYVGRIHDRYFPEYEKWS